MTPAPVQDMEAVYSVFVGGTEVNDYLLTIRNAVALMDLFIDEGYDDVAIVRTNV